MSEELKPCPFCGKTPKHNHFFDIAECYNCGGQASIDTWNTRHTPEGHAMIKLDSVLVPRGKPMPQTVEAWQYLGHQYEKELLANRDEIAKLKAQVNDLRQKLRDKEGRALVPVEALERAAEWFTESQGWNWLDCEDTDEMLQCVDELKKFKAVIASAQEEQ